MIAEVLGDGLPAAAAHIGGVEDGYLPAVMQIALGALDVHQGEFLTQRHGTEVVGMIEIGAVGILLGQVTPSEGAVIEDPRGDGVLLEGFLNAGRDGGLAPGGQPHHDDIELVVA